MEEGNHSTWRAVNDDDKIDTRPAMVHDGRTQPPSSTKSPTMASENPCDESSSSSSPQTRKSSPQASWTWENWSLATTCFACEDRKRTNHEVHLQTKPQKYESSTIKKDTAYSHSTNHREDIDTKRQKKEQDDNLYLKSEEHTSPKRSKTSSASESTSASASSSTSSSASSNASSFSDEDDNNFVVPSDDFVVAIDNGSSSLGCFGSTSYTRTVAFPDKLCATTNTLSSHRTILPTPTPSFHSPLGSSDIATTGSTRDEERVAGDSMTPSSDKNRNATLKKKTD